MKTRDRLSNLNNSFKSYDQFWSLDFHHFQATFHAQKGLRDQLAEMH